MKNNNNENDLMNYKKTIKQNTILVILIVLLFILVMIYLSKNNDNSNCISESSVSIQEIENFNSKFSIYSGKQTGAKLKRFCQDLISSIDEYREYPFQIPIIIIKNENGEIIYQSYYNVNDSENEIYDDMFIQTYIENIKYIEENVLINKHTYTTNFNFSKRGILDLIIIEY